MNKVQIWMIYGYYGNGKTLLLTHLAHTLQTGYSEIIANYKINDIQHFRQIPNFTPQIIRTFKQGSLALYSEAYKKLDSREAMKKENVELTKEIQQIRKTKNKNTDYATGGYSLIYDAERPSLIELRIRRITQKFIKAHGNMLDILKTDKSLFKNIKLLSYVRKLIHTKNFKCLTIDDLRDFFIYENIYYNVLNDEEINTNKFFVLDGKKIYDKYDSEEYINKGNLEYYIENNQ